MFISYRNSVKAHNNHFARHFEEYSRNGSETSDLHMHKMFTFPTSFYDIFILH